LNIACSSAHAGTNAFGESGGWSAVLQSKVSAVLGALFPIDDFYCSLFVLLLHSAWSRLGDLRGALTDTRVRMRSGLWADTDEEASCFMQTWVEAVRAAYPLGDPNDGSLLDEALERVHDTCNDRFVLYAVDPHFRLIVEAFVITG